MKKDIGKDASCRSARALRRAAAGPAGWAVLVSLAGLGCASKFETASSKPKLWFESSLHESRRNPVNPGDRAASAYEAVAQAPVSRPPAEKGTAPIPEPVAPEPGPVAAPSPAAPAAPARVVTAEGVTSQSPSAVPAPEVLTRPAGDGAVPVEGSARRALSGAMIGDEAVDRSPRHPEERLADASTRVARFWHKEPPLPVREVQPDPQPDEAARRRNFPRSVSYYQNASVAAGPTYRIDAPQIKGRGIPPQVTEYSPVLSATPTFLFQAVAAPFRAFFQPPLAKVVARDGANFPPSFTVAPPLPKE